MTRTSSKNPDAPRRNPASWLLLPLSLFPFVALLSYDARVFTSFPSHPSANWVGALGDGFAAYGYALFGLAIWLVPVICVLEGIARVFAGARFSLKRLTWLTVLLIDAACLAQVVGVHGGPFAAVAERINIAAPGGVFGYLVMTRCLSPLLSDFGSSVIMVLLLVFSVIAAVGANTLVRLAVWLVRWATGGDRTEGGEVAAEADGAGAGVADAPAPSTWRTSGPASQPVPAPSAEPAPETKPKRSFWHLSKKKTTEEDPERDAQIEAARRAMEDARRQRDAEKAAAQAEKQRIQEEKKAAKAAAKNGADAQNAAAGESAPEDKGPYILPALDLLNPLQKSTADHGDVSEMSQRLIDTLKLFGIDATLAYTVEGPVVTKYAIELAPGILYSKVTGLSDNLMGALHARSLRIEAPIPGEEYVGIEVPNRKPAGITFREIIESDAWKHAKGELPLLFGKNAAGKELVADLASMPHMLVAGATGQGKSVCLNALINGLLMTKTPEQLKLIMVDPKSVEFTAYAALPHLIVPVITDNKKVVFSLHWAVQEMEKRLKLFARARVRNIYDFNHRPQITQTDMFGADTAVNADIPKTVPYIVIIIDEVADLMASNGKEVTPDISRLTAKARAAGIHLILATQRPDAKIITGTIKANIPGRVAFKTASSVDSRTILDDTGAENLIGRGDMLFKGKDGLLVRAQGAWISDEEIARITAFIEQHSNTAFDDRFAKKLSTIQEQEVDLFADPEADAAEEKKDAEAVREQVKAEENASDFKKAVECIINTNRASTSHFQRRLGWGYNHSAKIMDMLEDAGIIGPQTGAGPRPIIMDQQELLAVFNGNASGGGATAAAGAAATDAGATDAGAEDAGATDAGTTDAGAEDAPFEANDTASDTAL